MVFMYKIELSELNSMREIVSTQRMKIDIMGNKIESLTHQLDRVRQYQTEHVQHVDSLHLV